MANAFEYLILDLIWVGGRFYMETRLGPFIVTRGIIRKCTTSLIMYTEQILPSVGFGVSILVTTIVPGV